MLSSFRDQELSEGVAQLAHNLLGLKLSHFILLQLKITHIIQLQLKLFRESLL